MLVFVDESGDTGRKIDKGSSKYFVVSLVVFSTNAFALECDERILKLKTKLSKNSRFEFHFQNNSDKIRQAFLKTVSRCKFTYFSVVIDKDPKKLIGDGFSVKESFYKYACNMVFTNASSFIRNATVVIDKSGSPVFQSSLKKYLNLKVNQSLSETKIKKLKQQHSHSNNLLQLADYVSGIINRKYQGKKNYKLYYNYICSKEGHVQKWPK